jgi:CRISPR-associated endonuclease/helicase Cas3
LDAHLDDVRCEVRNLETLVSDALLTALDNAARWHDLGKADSRFQVLLHGGDALAAKFAPYKLAKGPFLRGGSRQRWEHSELPDGFRHELVSLAMVCHEPAQSAEHDLILHLIASHHGRCRPFAPCVIDESAPDVAFAGFTLSASDRALRGAHRLDSEVADRFWALRRRFGWWGLAYLESLLRLSDWAASEKTSEIRGATT